MDLTGFLCFELSAGVTVGAVGTDLGTTLVAGEELTNCAMSVLAVDSADCFLKRARSRGEGKLELSCSTSLPFGSEGMGMGVTMG